MTARPILFSTPMINALRAGRKTQTRRALKPQPYPIEGRLGFWNANGCVGGRVVISDADLLRLHHCVVGDRLWVRECYFQRGYWESVDTQRTRAGRQKWRFVSVGEEILFEAPIGEVVRLGRHAKDPATVAWHKRLGRFMPRRYSRLTLTVTDARVQRLQEISEADAVAEGLERIKICGAGEYWKLYGGAPNAGFSDPRQSYQSLWEQINGAGAWDANPWVAAYTFTVARRNIDEAAP